MDLDRHEAATSENLDQLLTYKGAAARLNIPYFKIQRAARSGLIPTYSFLNSRKYVKLNDILKAMSTSH